MPSGNFPLIKHKFKILHNSREIIALDSLMNFTPTSFARVAFLLLKDLIIFDISSGFAGNKERFKAEVRSSWVIYQKITNLILRL